MPMGCWPGGGFRTFVMPMTKGRCSARVPDTGPAAKSFWPEEFPSAEMCLQ